MFGEKRKDLYMIFIELKKAYNAKVIILQTLKRKGISRRPYQWE